MSTYKRKGGKNYDYDFRLGGRRFRGRTGETEKRAADRFEAGVKLKAAAEVKSSAALNAPRTWAQGSSRYWEEVGRHHKAVDLTLKSAHPDASEIYFHLGFLLAAMHRHKEAVVWARKSLENPTNPFVEEAARGLLERLGEPAMEAN